MVGHHPIPKVTPALDQLSAIERARRALEDLPTEDRRQFHPLGKARPARTLSGRPTVIRPHDVPRSKRVARYVKNRFGAYVRSQTKALIGFHVPHSVAVCVKRWSRKEVLFAKKKAGFGIRIRGPRLSTMFSKIVCRRRR